MPFIGKLYLILEFLRKGSIRTLEANSRSVIINGGDITCIKRNILVLNNNSVDKIAGYRKSNNKWYILTPNGNWKLSCIEEIISNVDPEDIEEIKRVQRRSDLQ
jgi:hypothetical protein